MGEQPVCDAHVRAGSRLDPAEERQHAGQAGLGS